MKGNNSPKSKNSTSNSASHDAMADENSRQTVLSVQDVVKFQMVEGTREPSEAVESLVKEKYDIPDMSVGWYASPQEDELMD